jgi:aminoglycoside/choline kinase family phosphotransferase
MKPLAHVVENQPYFDFMKRSGRADLALIPMGADMGARRYFYAGEKDCGALLMDMSRSGLESGLDHFLKIAAFLNEAGIKAPDIYDVDTAQGLAMIEYLGDNSFGDAMRAGQPQERMYDLAADILLKMRRRITENSIELPAYQATGIRARVRQFVDYYMPSVSGEAASEETIAELESVWAAIEKKLKPCPEGFCHADFHLENIIYRPRAETKYGLIDFQDAFWGPIAYDTVNLLEDARKTVPDDIKRAVKEKVCAGMSDEELAGFDDWYAYLSAHFHCRVIGLFIKFSRETGTTRFLAHIPRLQNYLAENLKNPLLAPLKDFMEGHRIKLDIKPTL